MKRKPEKKIDKVRLDEARLRAGFKTDSALAGEIGVAPNQIARWRSGDSTPMGDNARKLAGALGVTEEWLYNDAAIAPASERQRLLDDVERVLGRGAREAIDHLLRLTPHHRAIVAGRINGWCEALRAIERAGESELPPTRYDIERAELALNEPSEEAAGDEPERPVPRSASAVSARR